MIKSELIEKLARVEGISLTAAEAVVNTVLDNIRDALVRDNRVELRGFGSFTVKRYEAYEGRAPKTGAPVAVKPKRLPYFKTGKMLKERLNPEGLRTIPLPRETDFPDDAFEPIAKEARR